MRPAFAGITIAALIGAALLWLFSGGSPGPGVAALAPAPAGDGPLISPAPRDPRTMRPMQLPAKDDPSFKVIRRPGDPSPAGPKGDRQVVMPGQAPPSMMARPGVVAPTPPPPTEPPPAAPAK